MRERSVGPASIPPRYTFASSKAHNRSAGMPGKRAGVGSRTWRSVFGARPAGAGPNDPLTASKSGQSRWPLVYSGTFSTVEPEASSPWTANAYSWRLGFQEPAPAGRTRNRRYHRSQSARTCRPAVTSAAVPGLNHAGRSVSGPVPDGNSGASSVAARLASGTRPASTAACSEPSTSSGSGGRATNAQCEITSDRTVAGIPAALSSRSSWSPACARTRSAGTATASASTSGSSGVSSSASLTGAPAAPGRSSPGRVRSTSSTADTGAPQSSPRSSSNCHWRASSHSGSPIRVCKPGSRSVLSDKGSSRDHVTTDGSFLSSISSSRSGRSQNGGRGTSISLPSRARPTGRRSAFPPPRP